MALKKYEETDVANIAKTIRSKTGTDTTYNISEMAGGVEEVFEAGRNDILDNSKYIPKSATGKVISLTDVSEVAHKVKVYGDNQRVDVYGKNLLPYPYEEGSRTEKGIRYEVGTDGSATFNGTSTAITVTNFYCQRKLVLPAGTYFLGGVGVSSSCYVVIYNSLSQEFNYSKIDPVKLTLAEEATIQILFQVPAGATLTNAVIKPFIVEEKAYDGIWEPYTHQTITATPNGTEIDSMCPNMNFFADGDLDILVEYYSSFGMNEEWNRFWDSYQNYGKRTGYEYAFFGQAFTNNNFYPKYDIVPTIQSRMMFYDFSYGGSINLKQRLEECGVTLDISKCPNVSSMFAYSKNIWEIPVVDFTSCSNTTNTVFKDATNLKSIEKIIVDENNGFTEWFVNARSLEHCIFSGVMASDINLQWSKNLDTESLVSLAVTLAHLITTEANPEGTNVPEGLQFTLTVTLSPKSWAILENTPYPGIDSSISCADFITSAKGWLRA